MSASLPEEQLEGGRLLAAPDAVRHHCRMSADSAPADLEALRQLPAESLTPPEPRVLFIESFVDVLDLDALGFIEARHRNQREPHPVSKLLKLFLFASLLGIVSMRAMARQCRWDLRLLYLSGYDPPMRSSIVRFWGANHEALHGVFETLIRCASEAGFVGKELHAIDGTKMRAAASMHTALHKAGLKKSSPPSMLS